MGQFIVALLVIAGCAGHPPDALAPEAAAAHPGEPPPWIAPAWFPEEGVAALAAIEGLDAPGPTEGGPSVRSPSVLVYDVDRGEVRYERLADEVRPVASLTKLVAALALASEDPDLDSRVCITPEHWPPRPGARSRMVTDTCYAGWDVVGAALVKSDNRAAMSFATLSGLGYEGFVERMNEVAEELGMHDSHFVDPSGIEEGNVSTARDMTRAVIAVGAHPELSRVASAQSWRIATEDGARTHDLPTTNRLAQRADIEIAAAKTGYTDPARYCYTALVRPDDAPTVGITVLGAEGTGARFGDVERVVGWVRAEDDAPLPAPTDGAPAGARSLPAAAP